jgi:glycosyltransferase involved in cell wall biosynthesis
MVAAATWLARGHASPEWLGHTIRILLAVVFGAAAVLFVNLMVCFRFLVPDRDFVETDLSRARVHVALTAFNDELAIAEAVREFKHTPGMRRLIVVDNNSSDGTAAAARAAGADEVVVETVPGYGSCCMRALAEGARDADVVILCEGDCTFSSADVRKLLAYLENADLVLGTRATQELRARGTQMDWLINPANQLVAKLVQLRFWGTRLTDVGCTYRAIRVEALRRLTPHLRVRGNHFSPHMFIEALRLDMRVIEIPVTFRRRVGESKGVGSNKLKAARVALRMLGLIYRA